MRSVAVFISVVDRPGEICMYEPLAKWYFRPTSALCSKFYPRNINYMPAVKFLACLDFERKSSFCKRLVCFLYFYQKHKGKVKAGVKRGEGKEFS
jgi:hypothetical protein